MSDAVILVIYECRYRQGNFNNEREKSKKIRTIFFLGMIGEGTGVSVAARTQALALFPAPATARVPHKRKMTNHLGDSGASRPHFSNNSYTKRRYYMELFVYDTDFNEADEEFEKPSFDTSSRMMYQEESKQQDSDVILLFSNGHCGLL